MKKSSKWIIGAAAVAILGTATYEAAAKHPTTVKAKKIGSAYQIQVSVRNESRKATIQAIITGDGYAVGVPYIVQPKSTAGPVSVTLSPPRNITYGKKVTDGPPTPLCTFTFQASGGGQGVTTLVYPTPAAYCNVSANGNVLTLIVATS